MFAYIGGSWNNGRNFALVPVKTQISARPKAFIYRRIEKFFEGIINNCCSKSEYVGSSRAICVCALLLILVGSKKAL